MQVGDDAMMFVRPEAFSLAEADEADDNPHLVAEVAHEEFEGNSYSVFLKGDGDKEIKMSLPNRGQYRVASRGADLRLKYDVGNSVVMPAGELASE
jgi:spermidine/putrescine transport system ATP-binding protein